MRSAAACAKRGHDRRSCIFNHRGACPTNSQSRLSLHCCTGASRRRLAWRWAYRRGHKRGRFQRALKTIGDYESFVFRHPRLWDALGAHTHDKRSLHRRKNVIDSQFLFALLRTPCHNRYPNDSRSSDSIHLARCSKQPMSVALLSARRKSTPQFALTKRI